jgi:hypothetical protein
MLTIPTHLLVEFLKWGVGAVHFQDNFKSIQLSLHSVALLTGGGLLQVARQEEQQKNIYDEVAFFKRQLDTTGSTCSMRDEAVRVSHHKRLAVYARFYPLNYADFVMSHLIVIVAMAAHFKQDSELQMLTYPRKFSTEYLTLLGIPQERLVFYEPCTLYHADEILYAKVGEIDALFAVLLVTNTIPVSVLNIQVAAHKDWRESLFPLIRETALPAVAAATQVSSDMVPDRRLVLVVDRRDKHGTGSLEKARVFKNHEEVLNVVKEVFPSHEIMNVRCSDFRVAEQIALFHAAEAVIGAEGACLANVLYMKQGALLVNIVPAAASYGGIQTECGFSLYWQIANLAGVRYWAFLLREYSQELMELPIKRFKTFLQSLEL